MKIDLRSRLNKEELLFGWMALAHSAIAEIIAKSGFDGVVIDLEHSAIDYGQLEPLFQIIEANGTAPLVRLSSNDPVLIKRVLDLGVHGIIVPMVNTPEEAKLAVEATKYPPEGFRSTGIYRAQNYGDSFEDYRFSANENIPVIIQIEHKDAVEQIEEILKVPGIDGLMVGPYDLSSSYGLAGKIDHPTITEAINKVIETGRKYNIKTGLHVVEPNGDRIKKAYKDGFSFVIYSNDSIILWNHYKNIVQEIKRNA